MSDGLSRADTLSMTGSNAFSYGAFSPNASSRNLLMPTKFKTEISVNNATGNEKSNKWGISGYKMPLHHYMAPTSPRFSIPKEAGKRFFEQIAERSRKIPEPGKYSTTTLWKGNLGKINSGKKQTFLDDTIKNSSALPGPSAYAPTDVKKNMGGKFSKSTRQSYLDDVRYLGENGPSCGSPNNQSVLPNSKSAKILSMSKKEKEQSWKPTKIDSPAFNKSSMEQLDKTMNLLKTSLPNVKFSKSPRVLFTDEIIKKKRLSPSPCQYSTVDDSRITKIMARPRRY